jgi:hypothetical protein
VAEPVQSWGTYIVGTVAASAEGYVICIVAAAAVVDGRPV